MAWDVTVSDPFAVSYIDCTAISAGAAAERAATLKTNKYQHLQHNYIFVPLTCEVMGSWSNVSIKFLDRLSEKITVVIGDTNEKSQWLTKNKMAAKKYMSQYLRQYNKSDLVASFITKTQKARFLGAQSEHAGAWLHAMPICCVCRKSIDKQTRHSLFNDVLWRSFARAKIQASKEPLGIFNDNKRPDGVTLVPWHRGKCVAWDVTVADTFAASYFDCTAISAGAAAERATILKTNKY